MDRLITDQVKTDTGHRLEIKGQILGLQSMILDTSDIESLKLLCVAKYALEQVYRRTSSSTAPKGR